MSKEKAKLNIDELIHEIWAVDPVTNIDRMTFETIGLAAESGELLNQFKKHRFYRGQDRTDQMLDELCDVYYHLNALCQVFGITRAELEQLTVEKHTWSLEKLRQEKRYDDNKHSSRR